MKAAKAETFPLTIKSGSVSVKIYRGANRGKPLYTLTFIDASGRKRENFADLAEAKAAAKSKAEKLSAGDHAALKLTSQDAGLYVAAMEAVAPTGYTLDVACREFAAMWAILGGHSPLDAARHYERTVLQGIPKRKLSDCIADYQAVLATKGLSKVYVDTRRHILTRFSKAFQCDLRDVTADSLRKYLAGIKIGPIGRNNHIKAVRGFFNFAKKQGWISKNESHAADGIDLAKIKIESVEIFTAAEIAAIFAAADEDYRPVMVLIAMCGVRREEVKRMEWSAVNFEAGTITLPANITKTGRKRKIDLQDAAKAFLAHYSARKGAIFAKDQERRLEKVIAKVQEKTPEFAWKANALRHSFCSYRLEQCRNAGQVALEAGNSAQIVMRHYAEVVSAADAAAFWALRPM